MARRRTPPPPAQLAERSAPGASTSKFPHASFVDVDDAAIAEACLLAQDVALAVRGELGVRRWSVERLAREAGVAREQVEGVIDGTAWVAPYTQARVLHAVAVTLEVEKPRRGRRT